MSSKVPGKREDVFLGVENGKDAFMCREEEENPDYMVREIQRSHSG